MEAEVCRPGGVDDERDAPGMGDLGISRDVAQGPDVGGIAKEHGTCVRVAIEGMRDRGSRHGGR